MGEGKFVMGEGKYVMGEEKFDRDKSDYGLRYHPDSTIFKQLKPIYTLQTFIQFIQCDREFLTRFRKC